MFVKKLFTYPMCAISKIQKFFKVKSSTYYFNMKTKMLVDFQIWISAPLSRLFNLSFSAP